MIGEVFVKIDRLIVFQLFYFTISLIKMHELEGKIVCEKARIELTSFALGFASTAHSLALGLASLAYVRLFLASFGGSSEPH